MKTLAPASAQGRSKVDEHVAEVLEMLVSRERFSGVVEGRDSVGTTIFIKSGERVFLAFVDPKLPLKPGDAVSFRIDGMRAKEVRKEILPVEQVLQEVVALSELPQPQPEITPSPQEEQIEVEEPPATTMSAAFDRLFKS